MKYLATILFSMMLASVYAQSTNDDFQQFRQQVMSDYQGFIKSVLDNYAANW